MSWAYVGCIADIPVGAIVLIPKERKFLFIRYKVKTKWVLMTKRCRNGKVHVTLRHAFTSELRIGHMDKETTFEYRIEVR